MAAYKDVVEMIMQTESMVRIFTVIEREPVLILCDICSQHEKDNAPVMHDNVHSSGFIRDLSLRTLMSAELIKREPNSQKPLFSYRPTPKGMQYYRKLMEEGHISSVMNRDSRSVQLNRRLAKV